MTFENTVMICGYGISGQAAARLAACQGKQLLVVDENKNPEMRTALSELKLETGVEAMAYFGWTPELPLPKCETAVISPGIRRTSLLYKAATEALLPGGRLLNEMEFALASLKCPFAAITGTNGKTTTTELTTALLKAHSLKAESTGNIGNALSDCALEALRGNLTFLVIETSSFQLEPIESFPPCPAAILNVASDHIDRHGTMDSYAHVKFKILSRTLPPEQRILNANLLPYLERFMPGVEATTFSAVSRNADFTLDGETILFRGKPVFDLSRTSLKGEHNAENIMAALALLRAVKGEDALFSEKTAGALESFRCSPHRMEVFIRRNGVTYVNDSKATNPHAVNAAVRAFANGKNLLLILGGLDKAMDFSELEPSLPHIKQAFLIGQCRETIHKIISGSVKCKLCSSFESAVRDACAAAEPGDCVMLSPATASMDMFKNYADRGDTFKRLVTQWTEVAGKR